MWLWSGRSELLMIVLAVFLLWVLPLLTWLVLRKIRQERSRDQENG